MALAGHERSSSLRPASLSPASSRQLRRFAASELIRAEELCASEVIRATYRGHEFSPHAHETWTIGLVTQGANHFRRGQERLVAIPGTVCVVNPAELHTGGGESMSYWDLMPSRALLGKIFPNTPIERLFLRDALLSDAPVVAAVRRMFSSFAQPASRMEREQAAVRALVEVFATSRCLSANDIRRDQLPRTARRARDYIEANLNETISLHELARVANLSVFHFCRVFEAAFGMPAATYIRSQRVRLASHRIRGGASLADAAAGCGFSDQAHMTRQFRSILGVTPAQWRG